jgi:hypothetical protein
MDNNDFIKNFSFIHNDYIIIYSDNNLINYVKTMKGNNNIIFIQFLLNNEEKKNTNHIIEIYPDSYIEELLIEKCKFIIYLSTINRSNFLLEYINKYNKYIVYKENEITYIDDDAFLNEINIKTNLNEFSSIYLNLLNNNIDKKSFEKNINYKLIKNIKKIEVDKINILTFYKKTDINILNIIQKKCILENLKNNNVSKIFILGHDLHNELKDILEINQSENKKLVLNEFNKNISYKDLIEFLNNNLTDKIVCIIRSDLVLPNQDELDNIEIDIISSNNEIIAISRIDRLINGNLVKSDKLNKILYSTEQDAWILRSPLKSTFLDSLDNIFFYDKYSELYFNQYLKINNYNIINNTNKYKIIRILHENNIDTRLLLNNDIKINNTNDIFLLPDNNSFDKIPINDLLKFCNLDENDIYEIKCSLFNKYLKNKIITELI